MISECTIYIDEAGDLGINRGTRWFILSGIVVNKSQEPLIRRKIKSLKSNLNLNEIHFRKLRNFEQKCYVVSELANFDFDLVNIIVDTSKITLNKTDRNGTPSIVSYNYCCRLLLERISWLLRDSNIYGDIILSSRGTSRDRDLINYIKKIAQYDSNEVDNRFNKIESKSASQWDLLQLADVCATSVFHYHEQNHYGFVTPCYCYKLQSHVYSHNNNYDSYGMKYYSAEMKPDKHYFLNNMICKK